MRHRVTASRRQSLIDSNQDFAELLAIANSVPAVTHVASAVVQVIAPTTAPMGQEQPMTAKKTTTATTTAQTVKAPKSSAKSKAESNGHANKDGLRKPQLRILVALSKATKPLSRAEISAKAPVDVAACVEYLGSPNDATRLANDVKHFPSLISLGLVKQEQSEGEAVVYTIAAKGKAAAAKAAKE